MNGADEFGAEHVRQIGRHGSKTAAIHGKDNAEEGYEQSKTAACAVEGMAAYSTKPSRKKV